LKASTYFRQPKLEESNSALIAFFRSANNPGEEDVVVKEKLNFPEINEKVKIYSMILGEINKKKQ